MTYGYHMYKIYEHQQWCGDKIYPDSNIPLIKMVFGETFSLCSCAWMSEWSCLFGINLVTLGYHLKGLLHQLNTHYHANERQIKH